MAACSFSMNDILKWRKKLPEDTWIGLERVAGFFSGCSRGDGL